MASQAGRASIISLRVSEEEQERLKKAAADRGVTVSDYVRTVVRAEVSGANIPSKVRTGALQPAKQSGNGLELTGVRWSAGATSAAGQNFQIGGAP